jgi:hypothetical protein
LRLELLAFEKIAATLRNDFEAIEPMRHRADRAAFFGVNQALRVAAIRCFGFALLAVKRALPPQSIREKSRILLVLESLDRAVVQPE